MVESKVNNKLGKTQREILKMLTENYMTIAKIAKYRGVTKQAVYKTVTKLRQKGYITRSFTRGLKKVRSINHQKGLNWRLHNQQFKIEIIKNSNYYKEILKKKNQIFIDGNTVNLYENSIIVCSNELRDFWGKTPDDCKAISALYWNDIFWKLQDRLKLILIKGENTRIKQFNGHFSEVGNELAKDCNTKKAKIKIKGEKDGLVWLLVDHSWGMFNELEGIHPDKAQEDMQEAVMPFFNDLRANKGYTPKMVLNMFADLIQDRKYWAEHQKSHVKAIQILGKGVGELRKEVKSLKNRLNQRKLKEWL